MLQIFKTENNKTSVIDTPEQGSWICLTEPTEDELGWLRQNFDLPQEFITSSLDDEESSHIDNDDDYSLIVIDLPYEDPDAPYFYYTMPLGIIVSKTHIITLAQKNTPVMREFISNMPKDMNTQYRTKLVLQLLLKFSTSYLQCLRKIDKRSSQLELDLRRSVQNSELMSQLDLLKSLVYFQTSLKANETTLKKLTYVPFLKMYEEDRDLLEEVMIEVQQANEMTSISTNILSGIMDSYASIIANNQNIIMKVLAAVTILLELPNMVFGFYGMNCGFDAGTSVWVPLAIAGVVTGIAAWVLHKKNMFRP